MPLSFTGTYCPSGWFEVFGYGCYSIAREPMNWNNAIAYCESQGAYLATIETTQENDYLEITLKTIEGLWCIRGWGGDGSKFNTINGPIAITSQEKEILHWLIVIWYSYQSQRLKSARGLSAFKYRKQCKLFMDTFCIYRHFTGRFSVIKNQVYIGKHSSKILTYRCKKTNINSNRPHTCGSLHRLNVQR